MKKEKAKLNKKQKEELKEDCILSEGGYTIIYNSFQHEINYIYCKDINQMKEEVANIIIENEIDIERVDNPEHLIGVFTGIIKPLKINYSVETKMEIIK